MTHASASPGFADTSAREPTSGESTRRRALLFGAIAALGANIGTIARRVVALALVIAQVLLVLRIGLLALPANGDNAVVSLILQSANALEAPFRGIVHTDGIAVGGGSVIDVTAFVALMAWTLVQGALIAILSLGARSRRW